MELPDAKGNMISLELIHQVLFAGCGAAGGTGGGAEKSPFMPPGSQPGFQTQTPSHSLFGVFRRTNRRWLPLPGLGCPGIKHVQVQRRILPNGCGFTKTRHSPSGLNEIHAQDDVKFSRAKDKLGLRRSRSWIPAESKEEAGNIQELNSTSTSLVGASKISALPLLSPNKCSVGCDPISLFLGVSAIA